MAKSAEAGGTHPLLPRPGGIADATAAVRGLLDVVDGLDDHLVRYFESE